MVHNITGVVAYAHGLPLFVVYLLCRMCYSLMEVSQGGGVSGLRVTSYVIVLYRILFERTLIRR